MGHVNNAVYLTYFEMARVAYHRAVTDVQAFDFTNFDFILQAFGPRRNKA